MAQSRDLEAYGPEYAARIRALVDTAPPLSARQRERLRMTFRGYIPARDTSAEPSAVDDHQAE
ncbi:hypothetical protein [Nocardiopsis sp. FIRDI 009]|uniref:hypothetical protein n=1 Tax=Nocardiopsis sp. FIRDI 009 TaxID=714197 RepID=UPI000E279668|nr:hypothetical protein [Nocardiopsis sp. FIRDI 009]